MNITLIVTGKLKEEYLRNASAEYEKRLSAFCKINVIELIPERLSENPSSAETEGALLREGEKILRKIPAGAYVIALCIEGKEISSEDFSTCLTELSNRGKSEVFLVIGSSFGLSGRVKAAADMRLSMSAMTFPHQLARIMLLEQLYRAFSIAANRKYHK